MVDSTSAVSRTAPAGANSTPQLSQITRRSVSRLRDSVRSGGLTSLAEVDAHTGEMLDAEARALFSGLPSISPATSVDEIIAHGLLGAAPADLSAARQHAKYRVGRELFVRAPVSFISENPRQPVGEIAQSEDASVEVPVAFTHRGVLIGKRGDAFIVDVAGHEMSFARRDIFTWNESYGVSAEGGSVSGVYIDYNDPRFKAYICAGYIEIEEQLSQLDFSQDSEEIVAVQARLIRRLAKMVDMKFVVDGSDRDGMTAETKAETKSGYGGNRAGALIAGGVGVDFVQRAVAGGYLQAFSKVLNFEIQIALGRTLRLGAPRGFVVITLLPSMRRFVCDPAWGEPLTDLPVAFFGPGWGHDRRLEGFEGRQDIAVVDAEIALPEL